MDSTRLIPAQFGSEQCNHALLEQVSSSKPVLDGWLVNAIEHMLRQATVEKDIPVSRSVIGVGLRGNTDCREDVRHPENGYARARAYQAKKRCFELGREAARAAFKDMGLESASFVGRGGRGEPLWPQGICGSITHCLGWSMAVTARCTGPLAIGIDLENVTRLHEPGIVNLICSAAERDWIEAGDPRTRLVMVFSAKEALYKALDPFLKRYIDFQDVELFWSDPQNLFECRFLTKPMPAFNFSESFKVYCRQSGEFIVSLMMCNLAGIIDRNHSDNFEK